MATYQVEFTKSAAKEFQKLSQQIKERIAEAIHMIALNPFSRILPLKKLKGPASLYRIRVGDYRVVYEVRQHQLIIVVIKLGHRSDVYRGIH